MSSSRLRRGDEAARGVPFFGRHTACAAVLLAAVVAWPAALSAQSMGDRLRNRVSERVQARTDAAMEQALDRVECAVTDSGCIARAERDGKSVKVVDKQGNEVTGGAAAASKPGEGAWANFDFVPGERVIFADDFTADRVGNFPRRLELVDGSMEVVEWQGRRWLRVSSEGALRIPLPETLPTRFTVEFDLTVPWWGMTVYGHPYSPEAIVDQPGSVVIFGGTEVGVYRGKAQGKSTIDPRRTFRELEAQYEHSASSRPFRVRIHGDDRYLKVYLDEQRIANIPNADFVRGNGLTLWFGEPQFEGDVSPVLLTDISVNAGGGALYDALMSDGRVVTRGILFDTGSDRLRPESTPTLREIGDMLKAHADLRILVEGHTDNVGDADANMKLSKKRAEAVLAYLQASHGIAASRLSVAGLGASKPVAPNETPEGRQHNRRVELVRM